MRLWSCCLALLLAFVLSACSHSSFKRPTGFSILQGLTAETTVEFSVLIDKTQTPRFTVITPQGETLAPEKSEAVTRPHSNWAVHKIRFAHMAHSKENFQLVVDDGVGTRDQRTFNLFSNQGDKLRFVMASCMDTKYPEEQKKMWTEVAKAKPEWLFLIGDNFYVNQTSAEVTDPQTLWDEYVEGRHQYELYYLKHLIPTYAVWDDNDYGQNNGHKAYSLKDESSTVFRTFFAQSHGAEFYTPGPGIAGRLALRGMHFTFLDNRSFRDAEASGEHFGAEQETWLFDDLKKAQLPTWIVSGDQFFGGYHKFESYEGNHPQAFEKFLTRIKEVATPFVFVSGDRHMTEIMQFPRALLGQLSFEFTTSPIHSKLYAGKNAEVPNPWRVIMRDDAFNFLLVDTSLMETSWNIQANAWGPTDLLFQRDLSLTTEALKDFTIEKRQKRRRYRRARWRRR